MNFSYDWVTMKEENKEFVSRKMNLCSDSTSCMVHLFHLQFLSFFVQRGEFPVEEWNDQFWKLKESIVGVKAPVERTSADLDPPTIFHICQDFDMIRQVLTLMGGGGNEMELLSDLRVFCTFSDTLCAPFSSSNSPRNFVMLPDTRDLCTDAISPDRKKQELFW